MTRTATLFVLVVALLFLPPSATQFQNPPPAALVPTWWLRVGVSAAVLSVGVWSLLGRDRVRGVVRGFHGFACAVAILCLVLLLQWPLEFPHLFGLSDAIRNACLPGPAPPPDR